MQKILTGLLLSVLLAACAMPETRIYSLNLTAGARPAALVQDATAAVIVTSPRHLAQPYIVYRVSPYQFAVARYAKWIVPPDEMVRDTFKDALSSTLFKEVKEAYSAPDGAYAVKIDLKRFERSDEGDVSFAAVSFDLDLVSPSGKALYRNSFMEKIKLGDRSFIGLAKGLSIALGEGIEEARSGMAKALSGAEANP